MAHQQVAEGVVAHVAHVGRAGGVRVHGEHIPRRPGVVGIHLVEALFGPELLPLLLDVDDVVGPCHGSRWYRDEDRAPTSFEAAPRSEDAAPSRLVTSDAGGAVTDTGVP